MTTLLRGGRLVNVFTNEIEYTNVLLRDNMIVGVGDYEEADHIIDLNGRYICPSFIDGHMHIESTMLLPAELAKVCIPHGTFGIVADPHEIANVCGTAGIKYMIEASKGLPLSYYFMLPSCVPATKYDENKGPIGAQELDSFFSNPRVLGLAEMMNYPGVIFDDTEVMAKLQLAQKNNKIINGHAPLLSGKDLDKYISAGISDDHECTSLEEAMEKHKKGQWIMIRQGSAAHNLKALIDLFQEPYCHRCMLVTDDMHPYDLLNTGHIDSIIREAIALGADPVTAIKMATLQPAEYYGIKRTGAVAPGYYANLLILDSLEKIEISQVFYLGKVIYKDKIFLGEISNTVDTDLSKLVLNSCNIKKLSAQDFYIEPKSNRCRIIKALPGSLITEELIQELNFDIKNGINTENDILKLAVCERHMNTGHIGLGYISGLGLKEGAIASTVSHDSHNLIIAGTNEADMALAGNAAIEIGGGLTVVKDGKLLASLPLPIAGLMSDKAAETVSQMNQQVHDAASSLGCREGINPFMNTAFISLSVIPFLKMTSLGLVDVDKQALVDLFV